MMHGSKEVLVWRCGLCGCHFVAPARQSLVARVGQHQRAAHRWDRAMGGQFLRWQVMCWGGQ